MKEWALLALFLLFAIGASAWGPETKKFVCEESVIRLWGANATVDCLRDISRSSQLEIFAGDPVLGDYGPLSTVINPVLIPELMFNDTENHHDYSDCPIIQNSDYAYLCGNKSENPATYNAKLWFSRAVNSSTLCERIQKFCIAASYFSNGYFPLNRIGVKSANGCEKTLSDGVDNKIIRKEGSWHVRDTCRFEYSIQLVGQNKTFRHKQTFLLTNEGLNRIISDLVKEGNAIRDEPYLTTTTTSVTTTSIIPKTTIDVETTVPAKKEKGGKGVIWIVVALIIVAVGYLSLKKVRPGGLQSL